MIIRSRRGGRRFRAALVTRCDTTGHRFYVLRVHGKTGKSKTVGRLAAALEFELMHCTGRELVRMLLAGFQLFPGKRPGVAGIRRVLESMAPGPKLKTLPSIWREMLDSRGSAEGVGAPRSMGPTPSEGRRRGHARIPRSRVLLAGPPLGRAVPLGGLSK